jgi:hypothetical protein
LESLFHTQLKTLNIWVGGFKAVVMELTDVRANLPALSASGYGKVDFEGYVFFDANVQYKFCQNTTHMEITVTQLVRWNFYWTLLQNGDQMQRFTCAKGFWLCYKMDVDTEKLHSLPYFILLRGLCTPNGYHKWSSRS